MRKVAWFVALAAGLLAAAGAAGQIRSTEIVEIDVPGKVIGVWLEDGRALVHTGSSQLLAVQVEPDGGFVAKPPGFRTRRLVEAPGILPQSNIAFGQGPIIHAWLSDATDRYRHGVLGDRLEAASLRVRHSGGNLSIVQAGNDAVFEDLQPRLADLDGDGREEIIVVKSYLDRGAALAVIGFNAAGDLAILAETPPIGRPNRWLNPVGAADFDGDGSVEIAYVETPHIGGRLMIWEWRGGGLVREHAEPGFSNHAIGSTELGLSAVADIDGDGLMDLAVPGRYRDRIRVISLAGGAFRELADVALGGEVATAIAPVGDALVFGLQDGRLIALAFRQ